VKVKLDENLGRSSSEILLAAGHDVATVYWADPRLRGRSLLVAREPDREGKRTIELSHLRG
jgi:hypothetical protein